MNCQWLKSDFEHIKDLISFSRLPNSLIISGNNNIGKNYFSLNIASTYLDTEISSIDNCQDYTIIELEEGAKFIKVDQIRNLLNTIYLSSNKRVIYIKDADKLNESSSNCLLKILEEPPTGALFILRVNKISNILPTIISRSSVLKCKVPGKNDFHDLINITDTIDIYDYLNLNSNEIKEIEDNYSYVDLFLNNLVSVINNEITVSDFSKSYSLYDIDVIIDYLLLEILNLKKIKSLNNLKQDKSRGKYRFVDYFIDTDRDNLDILYNKIINIKKNLNIINDSELALYAIAILFKRLL
tara:strand:- start:243 stop:1136 length:894 start_codon:yes stop_codon:yes gene_type:complete